MCMYTTVLALHVHVHNFTAAKVACPSYMYTLRFSRSYHLQEL